MMVGRGKAGSTIYADASARAQYAFEAWVRETIPEHAKHLYVWERLTSNARQAWIDSQLMRLI